MTRRREREGIMKLKIGWKKYTIIKKKKPKMGKELVNGSIDSDSLIIQIEESLSKKSTATSFDSCGNSWDI